MALYKGGFITMGAIFERIWVVPAALSLKLNAGPARLERSSCLRARKFCIFITIKFGAPARYFLRIEYNEKNKNPVPYNLIVLGVGKRSSVISKERVTWLEGALSMLVIDQFKSPFCGWSGES